MYHLTWELQPKSRTILESYLMQTNANKKSKTGTKTDREHRFVCPILIVGQDTHTYLNELLPFFLSWSFVV